jgi:hypothetical protein
VSAAEQSRAQLAEVVVQAAREWAATQDLRPYPAGHSVTCSCDDCDEAFQRAARAVPALQLAVAELELRERIDACRKQGKATP